MLPWAPAAVWAYLLVGHGRPWSTEPHLPPIHEGPDTPGSWPTVAVIVPARDEAEVLPETLPSLLGQDYPGHAWVVLVDDQSSDGTAALARRLAAAGGGRGLGLNVVHGQPRPPGWAGKPWAMAQGVRHALAAPSPPTWLLFTDADIWHPRGSLRELVQSAIGGKRQAVSLMARLPAGAPWERLMMPAFVYFFAQIYPFAWVNDPGRRTAAAAGGCMLVSAQALARAGGIDAVAAATIDDVALAKAIKSTGHNIWLGFARSVESRRRYPRLADIWEMVARSAYTQLRYSPLALAGTVAGLGSIYLAPPALVFWGLLKSRPALALAGAGAWSAMAASYLPTARYYRVPLATAGALPFTASVYLAMTLSSAWRHHGGRAVAWKGRPLS